jgi:cobalt-zinc-cadmium efflux system outer membrane protein
VYALVRFRTARALASVSCFLLLVLVGGRASGAWPPLSVVWQRAQSAAPDVVRAKGQVLVARAAGVGARMSSFQNPYMEFYVDGRVSPSSPGDRIGLSGILWLPFEIAGQRSARIVEADALLEWQRLDAVDAQSRAMGAAIAAYGQAVVSTARLTQARIAEKQALAEVDYFTARTAAGDATIVEGALAEAEVARYSQLRVEASLTLQEALERVAILTAEPEISSPPEDVTTDPPALVMADADAQVKAVLDRSALLRSLDSEARYYVEQRGRAEADRSPPFSLILTAARDDLGAARVGGGLAWTFPIIRRNEGEIAHASANEARAKDERIATAGMLVTRVRADVVHYQLSMAAIGSLDRSGLPAASKVEEATLAAFRAGKAELLRVINARRDLAIARSRRLDLVEQAWSALGDLAALRGELP